MATTPTKNAVPSESPRDLKFNAGKIDEFVTSQGWTYTDRLGAKHYTIEGIRYLAQQAMEAFGYVPIDGLTFQTGATINNPNEVLFNQVDNQYYRWTGSLAAGSKIIPANSTPQSTGGIGGGKWISVGDTVLRNDLIKGQYRTNEISVYFVPGVIVDSTTDNRSAAFAFSGKIYIPKGTTIRCNFLPDDDVRKFFGEGKILTKDRWGYEHVFDVFLSTNGPDYNVSQRLNEAFLLDTTTSLGVIGDSITDGVNTTGYTENPQGSDGNLSSTNYDHNTNGGKNSWFANMCLVGNLAGGGRNRWNASKSLIIGQNCALSAKKLIDGWAYRNFDYGFFQNSAYGNKAPDMLLISMGENDSTSKPTRAAYKDAWDKIIRKAWGYGSTVALVSVTTINVDRVSSEGEFKRYVESFYPSVQLIELDECVSDGYTNIGMGGTAVDGFYRATSGAFDKVHPAQALHDRMGAFAAMTLMPERFIFAEKGKRFLSIDESKVRVEKKDETRAVISMEKLATTNFTGTNAYVNQLKGWPYARVDQPTYIRWMIWSDVDSEIDLSLFLARYSDHAAGSSRILTTTLMHNKYDSNRFGEHVYFTVDTQFQALVDGATAYSPAVAHLASLRRGLNILEVIEEGSPTFIMVPMLMFTEQITGFSYVQNDRAKALPASAKRTIDTFSDLQSDPIKLNYACSDIYSLRPDFLNGVAGRTTLGASVKYANEAAMRNIAFWLSHKATTGARIGVWFKGTAGAYLLRFEKIDGSGSVIAQQELTISDSAWAYVASGGLVILVSRDNDTSMDFPNLTGSPSIVSTVSSTGGCLAVANMAATAQGYTLVSAFSAAFTQPTYR